MEKSFGWEKLPFWNMEHGIVETFCHFGHVFFSPSNPHLRYQMAMFHWKVDGELHILELHIFDSRGPLY